ncbi:hypothetical protein [Acinetobacter colistiniresistens]|uniref:hypothetical protein n=1 Tax=Acinetobacter colistiniresistens TaxID=280145 RepID=UPI001250C853|nr:hypothetical protein [Acinetobacter colistiniresistens]
MKLKLEIDVPEYDWVDVPTQFRTPLGEVHSLDQVNDIKQLIEYLQRLDDIEWIINSDHQHVRHPFCRELIRDRLRFVPESQIWHVGEDLSYFLQGFERRTGDIFAEYKYSYQVLSNGKKIQFKTFAKQFDDEDEALQYIAKIYTNTPGFIYDVER